MKIASLEIAIEPQDCFDPEELSPLTPDVEDMDMEVDDDNVVMDVDGEIKLWLRKTEADSFSPGKNNFDECIKKFASHSTEGPDYEPESSDMNGN
jgi:hypothetical protein